MTKFSHRIYYSLLYAFSLLPFSVLYLLSDFVGYILFDIIKYRKAVVYQNLKNSFPDKSETEIQNIISKFNRNFTDSIVEIIKMVSISQEEMKDRITVANQDLINKYIKEGKGIVCVVGHLFNWEYGSAYNISLKGNYIPLALYKTLYSEFFNNLFIKIRSKFNTVLISSEKFSRMILPYRDKAFILVMPSDQYPGKGSNAIKTTFLNQETYVFLGPERISKSLNSVVMFGDMVRKKRGYFEIVPELITDDISSFKEPGDITKLHTQALERAIIRNPDNWLWSHRRWK